MKIPTFTPALNMPPTTLHEFNNKQDNKMMK